MLINLQLFDRILDEEKRDFLGASTLEILYQLVAPVHEACNAQNELGEHAALIAELYRLLWRIPKTFHLDNVQTQQLFISL